VVQLRRLRAALLLIPAVETSLGRSPFGVVVVGAEPLVDFENETVTPARSFHSRRIRSRAATAGGLQNGQLSDDAGVMHARRRISRCSESQGETGALVP
jgi:hypothetical protein